MVQKSGFSLIELMIVVAIAGILAAVAYPAYTGYIQRGWITDATNQLATMRVQLEQYYQDNGNYGSTGTGCGNSIGTASAEAFTFSCSWRVANNAQTYVISATGSAARGMSGYTYTIDEANSRQTTAFPGVVGTSNCWLYKAGQSC